MPKEVMIILSLKPATYSCSLLMTSTSLHSPLNHPFDPAFALPPLLSLSLSLSLAAEADLDLCLMGPDFLVESKSETRTWFKLDVLACFS